MSGAMNEDGWTIVESKKNRQKRTSQQTGTKQRPPRNSRTTNDAHRSRNTNRSSFAKESPTARGKQKEYIPQNHRIYSPLNRAEHEIRLLVLKAGWGNMPLKCRLLQRPLAWAEETGFETISYCWGDPDDQDIIEVEGLPLRVPISAIEALQRFRYPHMDCLLWIDSICLNQLDLEERGHEVARMHHIYSRGQRNLIWLGPDDGNAATASCALHAILEDIKNSPEITQAFFKVLKKHGSAPRYPNHVSLLNETAIPLIKLFTRPWFTRLWVIQEAALSRHSQLFCGTCQMEFVNMMRLYQWIAQYRPYLDSDVVPVLERTQFEALYGIWLFADPEIVRLKEEYVFERLLAVSEWLHATDPRDHVYGILGLLQNAKNGETPLLLQPDYSKDALMVFRDATRYAIYQSTDLIVLSRIKHRIAGTSCSQRRPLSWVPRLSRKWKFSLDPVDFSSGFDAGLKTEVDKDLCGLISSEVMKLRGLFIEQSDQAVVTGQSEIHGDLESFIDGVSRFTGGNLLFEVSQGSRSALWRLLVAGSDYDRQFADDRMAHTFQALLRYHKEHDKLPPWPARLPLDASEDLVALSEYREAFRIACYRRRLFVTAGGLMGVGPQTMRPGDVAVILYGGDAPFILRYHEDANDYEFIGECYIDGIMFGEAVQKHREEGREDVIFNIR